MNSTPKSNLTRKNRLILIVCSCLVASLFTGFAHDHPMIHSLIQTGNQTTQAITRVIRHERLEEAFRINVPEQLLQSFQDYSSQKQQALLEVQKQEVEETISEPIAQPESSQPVESVPAAEVLTETEPVEPTPEIQPQPEPAVEPVDDGIWHVSYVYSMWASDAPADGSVDLWAEGWFIAHDYTANGQKISSLPALVEVDGRLYQYSSSWISGAYITDAEVCQIRANGGITFQTCHGSASNLMVHYDPVGAPYPYSFENYPFCSSDTEAIGYYREDYQ